MAKRPLKNEPHFYRSGGPADDGVPTCRDCHQSLSTSYLHTHDALKLMERVRAAEKGLTEQTRRAERLEGDLQDRVEDHAMAAKFVGEWLGISSPLPAATSIGCVQALAAYADDDIATQRKRAEQAEDLLRIAHETSNTSEAARAAACAELEAVRDRPTCAVEKAEADRARSMAPIRDAIAALRETPCTFWHCKGPDAPFVSMSTCRVCGAVQDLEKILAELDAEEAADESEARIRQAFADADADGRDLNAMTVSELTELVMTAIRSDGADS